MDRHRLRQVRLHPLAVAAALGSSNAERIPWSADCDAANVHEGTVTKGGWPVVLIAADDAGRPSTDATTPS